MSARSSWASAPPRPVPTHQFTWLGSCDLYCSSYQQRPTDHDQDPTVRIRGLGVDGRDLVLYLLEGEILHAFSVSGLVVIGSFYLVHTCSFSTMAPVPCVGAASKVSMESSRWSGRQCELEGGLFRIARGAYVERGELGAVGVEGVVVELDELLC